MTETKYAWKVIFTKDTSYLTFMGELWVVFCEDLGENWRVMTTPHCIKYIILKKRMNFGKWYMLYCLLYIMHTNIVGRSAHINVNTLRLRQNGRHFADGISKRTFLNENVRISIKISLKFIPKSPINNIPELVQIMAWCWPGDKTLSVLMMIIFTDAYMRRSASMS